MIALLRKVRDELEANKESRLIIVSDSNDKFISEFLESINCYIEFSLDTLIHCVKSNELTEFDGKLYLLGYDNGMEVDCKHCPRNLCKGSVVTAYIERKGGFDRTLFFGDGGNDLCVALKLKEQDTVFCRKTYRLEKLICDSEGTNKNARTQIKANVVPWDNAADLITYI
jgi:2-hydroxy-3-keto-5-methylthiopentenyl-1-phosphate phosphatase